MALLDMIPPEYWRQLRKELNALGWAAINSVEDAARQQAEQAEQERRARAYDDAIRRKKAANKDTVRRRAQLKAAQARYRERHGKGTKPE